MAKKTSCSSGGKFRVKKRYILLILLLIVVVVVFRFCGNRGGGPGGSGVMIEGVDFAADTNQISVNLLLTDESVPEAQWRTLSAGEDTFTPNGLAPDPLLGAYAVELVIDDASFSEDLLSQFGFVTHSLQQQGFGGPAESFRFAETDDDDAVFYLGYSKPASVTVEQGAGCITICLVVEE